jgi:2-polyprenyl-3-methyl-5-hydroxy-6-metoxy-1,4-benzoquinol methylase
MTVKKQCPVCCETLDEPKIHCKDYRITGEVFDICVCPNCGYAMTFPQPSPEEIGKYYQTSDYVSHSETKQGIVNKLYHIVRKKNTSDKLKLINRFVKSKAELLDIGCGTGYFLSVCKKDGWHVEGVEISENARAIAEARVEQSIYSSIDELIATGKQFTVITLWHVFEHLHDVDGSFAKLRRLLVPSGVLIIALPNYISPDAKYYGEHWAAYDVPRHLSHFSPMSVNKLTEKHYMRLDSINPMKFDAYYVSMMSEELKGRGKISAFLHGLWHGYRSNRIARKRDRYSSLIYIIMK